MYAAACHQGLTDTRATKREHTIVDIRLFAYVSLFSSSLTRRGGDQATSELLGTAEITVQGLALT